MSKISISEKFNVFSEQWSPKIIAQLNDYHIKLAKIKGDFVWHKHDDTDELFYVIDGKIRLDFETGSVELEAGELYVVPKGVIHKPFADQEAKIMLIEPAGTINTGQIESKKTVQSPDYI